MQPTGAWYYDSGFGGQQFTFTSCGAAATMAEAADEPLQVGESRGMRVGHESGE
ncbi:hypothetical protein [Amycolatopsis alba]|uniref:hypothetical protein n=1 Tax=Amycolatopsis alba TaxID=76020 RepID=UPI00037AFE6C|nr:hypothetical protein [Amycolatopsis alba]